MEVSSVRGIINIMNEIVPQAQAVDGSSFISTTYTQVTIWKGPGK